MSLPPPSTDYVQVAMGSNWSVGLTADGQAWAWGSNTSGRLGNGTTTHSSTPVAVTMPAGVTFTQISAGNTHSVAIGSDGRAYAWGFNGNGQLGDGTQTTRTTPVPVLMPAGVTSYTRIVAGSAYSIAIADNGKAYGWGNNTYGNLGNGNNAQSITPVAVTMPSGVTFSEISVGSYHSLAIGTNGKGYAWGLNTNGQLGNTSVTDRNTPGPITMPSGVTSFTHISGGGDHSLAIGNNGRAYAWGSNTNGRLGDGTTTARRSPVAVTLPNGVTSFTRISAGASASVAIGSNGRVYAWGNNPNGTFGNGTTGTTSSTPVAATMPSGVTSFTQVGLRSEHVVAVGGNGTDRKAYAWGVNSIGQVGDGTTTNRSSPVAVVPPVTALTDVTFGGLASTGLTELSEGTWQVIAPDRPAPGPVEVVVSWTLGGVAQAPIIYAEGFTYLGPGVEISTRAYRNAARTVEILRGGVIAPGATVYWQYTVKNTGTVPVSITELKRESGVLTLAAACPVREIPVGGSVVCTAQSTM